MKNVADIYPLSPMQQGMLFHALYEPEAGMYLEQKVFTLRGCLDADAFHRAWSRVIERHPVLRTAFIWKSLEEPLQVVRQKVKLAWTQEDWRGLPSGRQREQLDAFLENDRQNGMDLSQAPLMRVALFRVEEDLHQFIWTHHHLVVDGWSLPLIYKEVFLFYEAFRQGQDFQLPGVRPYRDYIAWLQRQDPAKAQAYWGAELKGFTTPNTLKIAKRNRHPAAKVDIYGSCNLRLTQAETESLQSFARDHQLTVNTLVQAAWGLLLSYYGDQKDVIFGATVSGRPPDLPGIESMVGLFINTLPVRVQIIPDEALLPWLKRLQTRQVEMRQFEYSPLVQIHGWSEVPRDRQLFETILVYENYPVEPASSLPASSLEISGFQTQERANYMLMMKAGLGTRLTLETLHDTSAFDEATILRMLEYLRGLLNSMAEHPEYKLRDFERFLRETERRDQIMKNRERKAVNLANFMSVRPTAVSLEQEELVKKSYVNAEQYPLVIQPAVDDVDLVDWAANSKESINAELRKHGAILFRGFGVDSVAAFENFARTICPDLFGEYGDLPQEKGKIYKSTPYPEEKTILFHNESSHMHRWPMKQWFYCVRAAREGGETPLVDCRKVYQRLDPEIVNNFAQKKLMYVRNFVEGLDVSWQSFFRTDDKSQVEEYCRQNGIEFEWTDNDGLRTRQISPGVARHPETGEMVFFNQVQLHHVYFLDPEVRRSLEALFKPEDYPRNVYYGDGTPIDDSVMEEILRVYWDTSVSLPWETGDVIMVDNMMTAHARNPFKGERKITVALGEMTGIEALAT